MHQKWIEPDEGTIPRRLLDAVGGHFLVSKVLYHRNIHSPDQAHAFLNPDDYNPTNAFELPGMINATKRLEGAIERGETILIWGDFDVDGQTSTTLLVEALTELGAELTYHIPVRASEGHGIKVDVLKQVLQKNFGSIKILLTCDTGISENKAIEFANENGLDVIITDHHDLPDELPPAYAIINPKMLSGDHPLRTMPGVGVVYKLIEAMFERQNQTTKNNQSPNQMLSTEKFLDLVALGIVSDIAELRGDTRYLLQKGLQKLRNSQRLSLKLLMASAKIIPDQVDEANIGFSIGPMLNALGRLSDANSIVGFLTNTDPESTRVFVSQLERLNEHRKLLTEQITQAALDQIKHDRTLNTNSVLVIAGQAWHTGIIGIVANRLVERFGKPTILLSIEESGIASGSARSIDGVHINEAIATQAELLIAFGGHPGAAGLSLWEKDIPQFRKGLDRAVKTQIKEISQEPIIRLCSFLPWQDLTLDLADDLHRLAPFGAGNPYPYFASRELKLVNHTKIGQRKEHLKLVVTDDSGTNHNVLWWNGVGNAMPEAGIPFDLAYSLHTHTYRGERELQIQLIGFRYSPKPDQKNEFDFRSIEISDYRRKPNPAKYLETIQTGHKVQIWNEGNDKSFFNGVHRYDLSPGKALVVWTTPPSPSVWEDILVKVSPKKLFLFAINHNSDIPRIFLERLTGLIKFTLTKKDGIVQLETIAAITCQPEKTIRIGITWLEAKGMIRVEKIKNSTILISEGLGIESENLMDIEEKLLSLLAESRAYRNYFQSTSPKNLT